MHVHHYPKIRGLATQAGWLVMLLGIPSMSEEFWETYEKYRPHSTLDLFQADFVFLGNSTDTIATNY